MPGGLAHLLEHVLFHPTESQLKGMSVEKYTHQNNGFNNGLTSRFFTTYIFQFDLRAFKGFVPVLAEAMRNPSFDVQTIKKEINNVNSEISMKLTDNKEETFYKFIKMIGDKRAPMWRDSAFEISLKDTSVEQIRAHLVELHKKYYSPNLMKMAIVGDVSHTGAQHVIQAFMGAIPNKNVARPLYNETATYVPPFTEETYKRAYLISSPVKKTVLRLSIKIPETRTERYFLASEFMGFLALYSHKDSFVEALKRQDLVSKVKISVSESDYSVSLFTLSFFILGDDFGVKIESILSHFYAFVRQVSQTENLREVYNVYSKISKKNLFFKAHNDFVNPGMSTKTQFEMARELASKMHGITNKEALVVAEFSDEFDEPKWKAFIDSLLNEPPLIVISSNKFKRAETGDSSAEEVPLTALSGIGELVLTKIAPFDKDISYASPLLDEQVVEKLKLAVDLHVVFAFPPVINTGRLETFRIQTNCQISSLIAKKSAVKTSDIGTAPTAPQNYKEIDVESVKTVLMSQPEDETQIARQRQIYDKFDCLKECLHEEAFEDAPVRKFKAVFESKGFTIYHRRYRLSMQEETPIVMLVESEYLREQALSADVQGNVDLELRTQLLCRYLTEAHKTEYGHLYLTGNTVRLNVTQSATELAFHSSPDQAEQFAKSFFDFLHGEGLNEKFDAKLFENIKGRTLQRLKDVSTYSISKLAPYFGSLALSRFSRNVLDPAELEARIKAITELNRESMVSIKEKLFSKVNVQMLVVGPIAEENAVQIGRKIESLSGVSYSGSQEQFADPSSYLDFISNHHALSVPENTHYIVDIPNPILESSNSVYSTYFLLGRLNDKTRYQLQLAEYYLHHLMYDELRVVNNFGYVALAVLSEIHHVA